MRAIIVDYGECKTTVTFIEAYSVETRVLVSRSDKDLGARNLDWKILEDVVKHFESENPGLKVLTDENGK